MPSSETKGLFSFVIQPNGISFSAFFHFIEFIFNPSRILWKLLLKCWSEKYYISGTTVLTHRYFKLSLQLISRFTQWIKDGIVATSNSTLGSSINSSPATSEPLSTENNSNSKSPAEEKNNLSSNGSNLTNSSLFHPLISITNNQWIYVYNDLLLLISNISNIYPSFVANLISSDFTSIANKGKSDVKEIIERAYKQMAKEISELFPLIAKHVKDHVIKKCTESLQPVHGIPATYRMTNKPIPTKSSYFITNISSPVLDLVKHARPFLPPEELTLWTTEILASVTERFEMRQIILITLAI